MQLQKLILDIGLFLVDTGLWFLYIWESLETTCATDPQSGTLLAAIVATGMTSIALESSELGSKCRLACLSYEPIEGPAQNSDVIRDEVAKLCDAFTLCFICLDCMRRFHGTFLLGLVVGVKMLLLSIRMVRFLLSSESFCRFAHWANSSKACDIHGGKQRPFSCVAA